jgi:hypothetical protein
MAGWNSDGDIVHKFAPAGFDGWGWGDWAIWAGVGTSFSETLGANIQVAYTDSEVLAVAGNLKWYPVPNLLIMPEVTYSSVDNDFADEDQWNAMVRFQRSF